MVGVDGNSGFMKSDGGGGSCSGIAMVSLPPMRAEQGAGGGSAAVVVAGLLRIMLPSSVVRYDGCNVDGLQRRCVDAIRWWQRWTIQAVTALRRFDGCSCGRYVDAERMPKSNAIMFVDKDAGRDATEMDLAPATGTDIIGVDVGDGKVEGRGSGKWIGGFLRRRYLGLLRIMSPW